MGKVSKTGSSPKRSVVKSPEPIKSTGVSPQAQSIFPPLPHGNFEEFLEKHGMEIWMRLQQEKMALQSEPSAEHESGKANAEDLKSSDN